MDLCGNALTCTTDNHACAYGDEGCIDCVDRLEADIQALIDAGDNLILIRAAPESKPLTLDELRQMDGEPVWVEHFDSPCSIKQPGEWLILKSCNPTVEHPYVDFKDRSLCALYYGQGWLAYARKPEQEGK